MTIKEQVSAIDKKYFLIIKSIENSVIPIVTICVRLLRLQGEKKGFIRRRYQFISGPIEIIKSGRYSPYFSVRYNGHLVLECNETIQYAKDSRLDHQQYLYFYKSGSWETLLVKIYHQARLNDFEKKFDLSPEYCSFYDHDEGFCSKDPKRDCPCVEISWEEV